MERTSLISNSLDGDVNPAVSDARSTRTWSKNAMMKQSAMRKEKMAHGLRTTRAIACIATNGRSVVLVGHQGG